MGSIAGGKACHSGSVVVAAVEEPARQKGPLAIADPGQGPVLAAGGDPTAQSAIDDTGATTLGQELVVAEAPRTLSPNPNQPLPLQLVCQTRRLMQL